MEIILYCLIGLYIGMSILIDYACVGFTKEHSTKSFLLCFLVYFIPCLTPVFRWFFLVEIKNCAENNEE